MIKAVALDDERPSLEILEHFCRKTGEINLLKTFDKTQEARFYLEEFPVDLLFLDINMPSISGIDFYKSIAQQTLVIFTTAYSEYAVQSYELNAVDYLLKPFSYERFLQAVEKVKAKSKNENIVPQEYIFLRADYGLKKIQLSAILYVEALDNYLKIYLKNQQPLIVRMTMKLLLEKLPKTKFSRVHRCYIIAHEYIDSYRNKTISINEAAIPVGTSYENDFVKSFRSPQ